MSGVQFLTHFMTVLATYKMYDIHKFRIVQRCHHSLMVLSLSIILCTNGDVVTVLWLFFGII